MVVCTRGAVASLLLFCALGDAPGLYICARQTLPQKDASELHVPAHTQQRVSSVNVTQPMLS